MCFTVMYLEIYSASISKNTIQVLYVKRLDEIHMYVK